MFLGFCASSTWATLLTAENPTTSLTPEAQAAPHAPCACPRVPRDDAKSPTCLYPSQIWLVARVLSPRLDGRL